MVYISHIVIGSLIDPGSVYSIIKSTLSSLYNTVSYDNLNTLLFTLDSYMNEMKPTIVFFHCSAGIDRTGYVSGAYKMKYYHMSLKEVMK